MKVKGLLDVVNDDLTTVDTTNRKLSEKDTPVNNESVGVLESPVKYSKEEDNLQNNTETLKVKGLLDVVNDYVTVNTTNRKLSEKDTPVNNESVGVLESPVKYSKEEDNFQNNTEKIKGKGLLDVVNDYLTTVDATNLKLSEKNTPGKNESVGVLDSPVKYSKEEDNLQNNTEKIKVKGLLDVVNDYLTTVETTNLKLSKKDTLVKNESVGVLESPVKYSKVEDNFQNNTEKIKVKGSLDVVNDYLTVDTTNLKLSEKDTPVNNESVGILESPVKHSKEEDNFQNNTEKIKVKGLLDVVNDYLTADRRKVRNKPAANLTSQIFEDSVMKNLTGLIINTYLATNSSQPKDEKMKLDRLEDAYASISST